LLTRHRPGTKVLSGPLARKAWSPEVLQPPRGFGAETENCTSVNSPGGS